MTIIVRYAAVDGYRVSRKFASIAGARKFAARYVGKNPDTFGGSYAVSDDGVGTVRVEGCTLAELFGHAEPRTDNSALWIKAEPYDREAEAAADWRDEQEDRRAWGA